MSLAPALRQVLSCVRQLMVAMSPIRAGFSGDGAFKPRASQNCHETRHINAGLAR